MRIVVGRWTRRRAGGIEAYLAELIPGLVARGHDVALVHEVDDPADREPIVADGAVAEWSFAGGSDAALDRVRRWRPDVLFVHGLEDPSAEAALASIGPTVLFAHEYRGTCISGTKTFAAPDYQACNRILGWPCLAHYLPRQCGGRSPATMMLLYGRESARRDALIQYRNVLSFSQHIAEEYVRHGVPRDRVRCVPAHVTPPGRTAARTLPDHGPLRLLFLGRMEAQKGGDRLIAALPDVQAKLGRGVHVTFAGDGRTREDWEALASDAARTPDISIEFTGWLAPAERDRLLATTDLLVVPSVWPEPFGLVGLEAAGYGVPAAAFALGGIPEWLKDGVSGALAEAKPPSPERLADAIVCCVSNPQRYRELSAGALAMAARHSLQKHLDAVLEVLAGAAAMERVPA